MSLDYQEYVYLLSLVKSLGLDTAGPVWPHGDNQGAIRLDQNPFTNSRSIHIVEQDVIQLC